MVVKRDIRLSMLISAEEQAMLKMLADKEGLSVSDWVRQTVRAEYVAGFGAKRPKKP